MRFWFVVVFLCGLTLTPALSQAQNLIGLWMTAGGRSHVEVNKCGAHFCGRIIWLKQPFNSKGEPLRDKRNVAAELRNRPIVGILVLKVAVTSNGALEGRVYDPERGKTYPGSARFVSADVLRVTGCAWIGFPCKTRTWQRISQSDPRFPMRTPKPPPIGSANQAAN